jgi:hypothetical protein
LEDPDPNPDPVVRGMYPRIRIHPIMSRIRNTGKIIKKTNTISSRFNKVNNGNRQTFWRLLPQLRR